MTNITLNDRTTFDIEITEIPNYWPFKLYQAITNDKSYDNYYNPNRYINVNIAGMMEVVNTALDDKEKLIIMMRFKYDMSYSEIGKHFNLSGNTIRQHISRAIRKLRQPILFNKITAVSKYELLNAIENNQNLETKIKKLELLNCKNFKDIDIDELNLSVRTYNYLKRKGIDSIIDFITLPEKDRMHIKDIWNNIYYEFISKLNELGIVIDDSGIIAIITEE